jgi:transcriptional regulator with XRE-family HTH domain
MPRVFGDYLREQRARRRLTLRKFCQRAGLDPGNVSKLERGLLPAPESEETLTRYASALRISAGTKEWQELVDVAAASRGHLPGDLISDQQVLSSLPVLFRTLRGQKLTPQLLEAVIQKVREARSAARGQS